MANHERKDGAATDGAPERAPRTRSAGIVRALVAALYVFPPSLLMGRFFPAGFRRFAAPHGGTTPFLFAANGAASVLGAAFTQALALNAGYGVTTIAGGILYASCAVLLLPGGTGGAAE
jgi:hypothetical protein